ncbi:MAG: right-handed parallel beta-helix repeat-containing protein [Thermoplasmata archaeon]
MSELTSPEKTESCLVVGLKGTETDPYIIENLEVYSNEIPAIWIGSHKLTLEYIKIRKCVLHGNYSIGGYNSNGIKLENTNHIIIEDTIIENFTDGILLQGCSDVVITGNKIWAAYSCIELNEYYSVPHISCSDVRIFTNDLAGGIGINVQHAHDVKVINNRFSIVSGGRGIFTYEVRGLEVISNNFFGEIPLSFGQADSSEIYHNNFWGGKGKGVVGGKMVEICIGQKGALCFYNTSLKEGNYWCNWDGEGWGTASAYPIEETLGYGDIYPLKEPLKNITIKLEIPDKISGGKEYKGKIAVKDTNGAGVPGIRVMSVFTSPQWVTPSFRAISSETDENGILEFTIYTKSGELGRTGRILFTVICSKAGFIDGYYECYILIEEGKDELIYYYSAVVVGALVVIIGLLFIYKGRRRRKRT